MGDYFGRDAGAYERAVGLAASMMHVTQDSCISPEDGGRRGAELEPGPCQASLTLFAPAEDQTQLMKLSKDPVLRWKKAELGNGQGLRPASAPAQHHMRYSDHLRRHAILVILVKTW